MSQKISPLRRKVLKVTVSPRDKIKRGAEPSLSQRLNRNASNYTRTDDDGESGGGEKKSRSLLDGEEDYPTTSPRRVISF